MRQRLHPTVDSKSGRGWQRQGRLPWRWLLLLMVVLVGAISLADDQWPSAAPAHRPAGFHSPAQPLAVSANQEIAQQILHRCLLDCVWGKPLVCDVRQTIRMYSKKRISFGKFVRGGHGSGKLRLSLQTPAADQMNSLLQISDGELLSTLVSVGPSSFRTQVDLGKIRERLEISSESLRDPVVAMYLAIGGQAELLRKLCQQYQWTEISESKLGDNKVWLLTGRKLEQPPLLSARAAVDLRLFDKQGDHKLQHVAVAIGHADSAMPYWLFQVEQWTDNHRNEYWRTQVVTEWDAPQPLGPEQLVPNLFRFRDADSQPLQETREETKLYLPPAAPAIADSRPAVSARSR